MACCGTCQGLSFSCIFDLFNHGYVDRRLQLHSHLLGSDEMLVSADNDCQSCRFFYDLIAPRLEATRHLLCARDVCFEGRFLTPFRLRVNFEVRPFASPSDIERFHQEGKATHNPGASLGYGSSKFGLMHQNIGLEMGSHCSKFSR